MSHFTEEEKRRRELNVVLTFCKSIRNVSKFLLDFKNSSQKFIYTGDEAQLIWFYLRKNEDYQLDWKTISTSTNSKTKKALTEKWSLNEMIDPNELLVEDLLFRKYSPFLTDYKNPDDKNAHLTSKAIKEAERLTRRKERYEKYAEVLIPLDCPEDIVINYLKKNVFSKGHSRPGRRLNNNEFTNLILNIPCAYSSKLRNCKEPVEEVIARLTKGSVTDIEEFIKERRKQFKIKSKESPFIFFNS